MRRFELIVTDENGVLNFSSENDGFNALELIAFLEMKKHDVVVQVEAQTNYDREIVKCGKKFEITERDSGNED